MMKDMETRLQTTMEDRLLGIKRLISGLKERNLHDPEPSAITPGSTAHSVPVTVLPPSSVTSKGPVCSADVNPALAGATGPLSDALRQLSLAMDPVSASKAEGIQFRPEFYAQHKLRDVSIKSLDYQKLSLHELTYGMICVLEHLLTTGNESWVSYLQHMKFIARQASNNSYLDMAFAGYDRMVIDKYLSDKCAGFAAGDMLCVSSNFHAANFRQNVNKVPKKLGRRGQKGTQADAGSEDSVDIPSDWPDEICYYINRRRCYGRCVRSHMCRRCKGSHKDIDCKLDAKKLTVSPTGEIPSDAVIESVAADYDLCHHKASCTNDNTPSIEVHDDQYTDCLDLKYVTCTNLGSDHMNENCECNVNTGRTIDISTMVRADQEKFCDEHNEIYAEIPPGYIDVGNESIMSTSEWFQLPLRDRVSDCHCIGGRRSQMNHNGWVHELSFETDLNLRKYLYEGITNGFKIVDQDAKVSSYECDNYDSVLSGPAGDYINALLQQEIAEGKYIFSEEKPYVVHALGAVPKSDNTFRPITDCKQPLGHSINNFMDETHQPFTFSTVDDVASMVTRGCYMSCTDIKSAYRSVTIHPDHWKFQGIS